DLIQPDLSKNGGISEAKAIAEMAGGWDIPFAPHFLGGAVCFAASIHFMASIPGGQILELDANPNLLREQIFTITFVLNEGKVQVPDRPGLGFELDGDFVNYYKKNIQDI